MNKASFGAITLLVCWAIFKGAQAYSQQCNESIRLPQGMLQGEEMVSTNGGKFCSFRSMPYAKAPVGELRFKDPKPAEDWTGIFNATIDGSPCPQVSPFTGGMIGDEDCLTLNVYTPSISPRSQQCKFLPVLVFIHGGGFAAGDAGLQSYPPHRFMDKPVVLVTIFYRLGIFGYLSTASADASGNYGLLDQRMALQWVQENIEKFCGDPRKVTIFGESAGSASVMYQMISRGSKGLFNGVIAQSGTVLNHWAIQKDPYPFALQLGQALNCSSSSRSALVECLRYKPAPAIISTMVALKMFDSILGPFVPVVENPAYGKFLTKNPMELLEKGEINDVPLIIGTTKHEMAFVFFGLPAAAIFDKIDKNFSDVLLPGLLVQLTKLRTHLVERSHAVVWKYFDKIDKNNRTEVMRTAIQFLTDLCFNAGTSMTARLLAKRRFRVYNYLFEHAGNVSFTRFSGEKDVKHGDDLFYLFNFTNLTAGDQSFSQTLLKMWTNFPRFQNPTPFSFINGLTWTTTGTGEKLHQLIFGEDDIKMALQSRDSLHNDDFINLVFPYSLDPNE